MDTFYAAIGRFAVRFRYPIVVAWVAITIICVIIFPSLSSVISGTANSSFLPASAPSVQAAALAMPFENTQYASATIVATRDPGPLTSADQAAIDQLEQRVRAMPQVKQVNDLSLSPDGAARQIAIQADVPANGTGDGATLVSTIRQAFGQVDAPAGLAFHLAGPLAANVDARSASQATQNVLENLVYLLILGLLLLAFRALLAPVLTLLPAALVLLLASPVIAGAVTRLHVPASNITQEILILILLGAGTDYGLFLTFRVREEMQRGLDPQAAVVRAVQTIGETLTFSALTVMAALAAVGTAQFGIYQSFGPAIAIGIALLLLAGLTLTPALLAIFGRTVFWPTSTTHHVSARTSLWSRMTARLMQRPVLTLSLGVLFFAGLALGQLGTSLGGFRDQASGPAGADSTAGTAAIAAHYPTSDQNPAEVLMRFPTSIWDDPTGLATAEQGLAQVTLIQTVLGPLNPNGTPLTVDELTQWHHQLGAPQSLPAVPSSNGSISPEDYQAYRATGQYISADGQTVQFVATLKDASSSPAAIAAIPALRSAVAQVAQTAGASQQGIVSTNAVDYDITSISQSDLSHMIPLVAGLIALLLGLVLRSLVAPLYLLVSVALSYLATWGVVALLFVHLRGDDGVSFILPFILFVFLMALGSDYNILVMRRIREEAEYQPLGEAVRAAITHTGGTITAAGVILAGTFAVLALKGTTDADRSLGFGLAAGILMDTFLIRTLILPAVVVVLGKWNWWPTRVSHRPSPGETPKTQVDQTISTNAP